MPDTRSDPTQNSDAARNQANSDSRNYTTPADTRNWDSSARDAYEVQWKYNQDQKST